VFDPDDPDTVYAESQSGFVHRFNIRNGELKQLRPEPPEGQPAFRFHWNAPLIPSVHAKGKMYLGGNRVFALTDRGEHWAAISPDLGTANVQRILTTGSGAETYGVVYTLSESPKKPGLLWAGTDDGKLWVTEDDGKTWTDLTANVPAPAKEQWVGRIHASFHDSNVAYLAVAAYRTGTYAPLAWRTSDLGKTWELISTNLPPQGPVNVVRDDPVNPNLLFAGTSFGLFVSLDRGGHWNKLGGLPTVAVDDLVVHPRDHDLVVATHGRSLYIIDDITALEAFDTTVQAKAAWLFQPRPAFGFYPLPGWVDSAGSAAFRGANPPEGMPLTVYVREFTGDKVTLTIKNASDRPVANLSAPGTPGLSRVVWGQETPQGQLSALGGGGPRLVKPGE
jgi:hypothetical protein